MLLSELQHASDVLIIAEKIRLALMERYVGLMDRNPTRTTDIPRDMALAPLPIMATKGRPILAVCGTSQSYQAICGSPNRRHNPRRRTVELLQKKRTSMHLSTQLLKTKDSGALIQLSYKSLFWSEFN